MNKDIKPTLIQYDKNEWEFHYPENMTSEKAEDDFWNAVELLDYDDPTAEKVFKKLIATYPFHIDAYNHLAIAFRNQKKDFESLLTAEKGFGLANSFLPETIDWEADKICWYHMSNRAFLRAFQIYGLECHYHKNYDEAIQVYKMNLSLNPEDHQGIRYLLLETLFAVKDYEQAQLHLDQYKDDYSIEFKFGAVAIAVLNDDLKLANKKLADAVETNKFFVEEVVKSKHTKPQPFCIPGEPHFDAGITVGSLQQAFDYWKRNEQLYKNPKITNYFKKASTDVV